MRHSVLLAALTVALAACSDSSDPGVPVLANIASPSSDGIANSLNPAVRWSAARDADRYRVLLWAGDAPGGTALFERTVAAPALETTVDVALTDGRRYTVQCEALDAAGAVLGRSTPCRFAVRVPPDWMPGIAVGGDAPELGVGGYTLLNVIDIFSPQGVQKIPALVLVNAAGEIVWWIRFDRFDGILLSSKVLPNGHLLFIADETPPPQGAPNMRGYVYETDWNGNVFWRSREGATPHHEVEPLPDGSYMILNYAWSEAHEPTTGAPVTLEGDAIEIVDPRTDEVLWTWNIFDHVDPLDWWVPEVFDPALSFRGQDWSHANALEWDAARGVIWMSLRSFDSVFGIAYPSGEIAYQIGKRQFTDPVTVVSHQHAPELQPDGSILLFDNGNTHVPPESRAVLLQFDAATNTSQVVWEWKDTPAFYDFAVGDADRLSNGNVLVTAGISRRVIEVVPSTGTIAWELALVQDPPPGRFAIYRSEHVPVERIPAGVLPYGH